MKEYDIIVIGSGGGTKLARPAADLGYKAAIIEKDKLGGTCLNRGCIPSKMLIHPADVAMDIREADKHFFRRLPEPQISFSELTHWYNSIIQGDSDGIAKKYANYPNLDFYAGTAEFTGDKTLRVNGQDLCAERIVIATGSRPMIPPISGLAGTPYWTSTEALTASTQPRRLIVIGGGYIGCELGFAYAGLGTDVSLFTRSGLLAYEDEEIQHVFTEAFQKQVDLRLYTDVVRVQYDGQTFSVTARDRASGKEFVREAEAVLVATGIVPNSDTLALSRTNIKTDPKGYIVANNHLETTVPSVYAMGDVVGNYLFRHSVNFEGEYLFAQLFGNGKKHPIDYPPMPHAVFTRPQIAGVGYTERDCEKVGAPFVIGRNQYKQSAMGMALRSDVGMVKLLFHRDTKKLLGAHIIGAEASDMIHMLIYAQTFGATVDDLLRMIYIHPALPENIRNAARDAERQFVQLALQTPRNPQE